MASRTSHPDRVFHHPDHIQTTWAERGFMTAAVLAVLVGLPVLIGAMFEYAVPWLGALFAR
jgi:hypothetical protein